MRTYEEREKALTNAANGDFLTGLLNRRGFYEAVDVLRAEDTPLALYLFDVDNLKYANDAFGHEVGDGLLKTFADILKQKTRDGDILCRYGGDEFIVVLKRIGSPAVILRKGEEICRTFGIHRLPDGTLSACSGGIVMCGEGTKPTAEIIEKADKALYRAKRDNKGGCYLSGGTV